VAYRELRGLEAQVKQRIHRLAAATGVPAPAGPLPYYPIGNLHGIDIERIAVMIARVTLWMGHRQMVDRYGEAEPVLPLVDLSHIRAADALRADWPQVDAIIGNPPFLGAKLIRPALGDEYADWLAHKFGVGVKDLCVYWFRRAADSLRPGQRAGLVGTNSVSQTMGRAASLSYIEAQGGVITDAVSSQRWPGDAKVHVSIVSWVSHPPLQPAQFTLDGRSVAGITSQLRAADGAGHEPAVLPENRARCFAGVVPQGKGFVIDAKRAGELLRLADAPYSDVVRPFLTGADLADDPAQSATRWIVDFESRALEQALAYPAALDLVRGSVKAEREQSSNRAVERRWWLFGRRVPAMRSAIAALPRWAAGTATGKRFQVAWQPSGVCPNNAVIAFAFDDDYSMGILLSRAHDAWAWARSSTLETRLRYTNAAVFDTFPWPSPSEAQRAAVAQASADLYGLRSRLCVEHALGLTRLYNLMDEGGFTDLAAAHRRLDEAVAAAYGWPRPVAQDSAELVRRLTALNRDVTEGRVPYAPFG